MAQCHGTVTVMYCLCIGVCVHLFQTTALQEGTAAACRICQGLVGLEKLHLPGVKPYMILYGFSQLILGPFLCCLSALKLLYNSLFKDCDLAGLLKSLKTFAFLRHRCETLLVKEHSRFYLWRMLLQSAEPFTNFRQLSKKSQRVSTKKTECLTPKSRHLTWSTLGRS